MKKRVAKTTGLSWLELSITAFNGSGYGDRESPEAFLESYRDYKLWKNKPEAVKLLDLYYQPMLALAAHLLEGPGPGMTPSPKLYEKFRLSRNVKLL